MNNSNSAGRFALSIAVLITTSQVFAQKAIKTFYDSRKTKVHESYMTDNYGVKNGKYVEYSEYGGILQQGNYKNDIKVGVWQYKDEKGISTNVETYDESGEKNGKWIIHCIFNPKIKSVEGNYRQGKKDGVWTEYECSSDPLTVTQRIKSKETYSLGVVAGECEYHNEDGRRVGMIKNGVRTGVWKEYDKQNRIAVTFTYTERSFGPYAVKLVTVYHENGKVAATRTALQNYQDIMQAQIGEELLYDTTGILEVKRIWNKDSVSDHYKDAYFTATHQQYYPSGKLELECDVRFERGYYYFTGQKIAYNEDGTKKWEGKYNREGRLIPGTYVEYLATGQPDEKTRK